VDDALLERRSTVETLRAIIPERRCRGSEKRLFSRLPEALPQRQSHRRREAAQAGDYFLRKLYEDDLYSGDALDPITTSLVR